MNYHATRRQIMDCPSPLTFSKVTCSSHTVHAGRGLARSRKLSSGQNHHSDLIPPRSAGHLPELNDTCTVALKALDDSLRCSLWRWELAVLATIIALFNLPLLSGGFSTQFIFQPGAVGSGEWWRVFIHPFVHVSPYHLALDSAAFFLGYIELQLRRLETRLALILAATIGGLAGALIASPLIFTHGLCGLSGVAHGLTAVVSLELLRCSRDKLSRSAALLCFVGIVAKSILEAISGSVLFASWHLGSLGTPIAACHAGGILGALSFWLILETSGKSNSSIINRERHLN